MDEDKENAGDVGEPVAARGRTGAVGAYLRWFLDAGLELDHEAISMQWNLVFLAMRWKPRSMVSGGVADGGSKRVTNGRTLVK